MVTCKLGLAVRLGLIQLLVQSVIPYLRPLPADVYFENYYQTLTRIKSTFLLLSNDDNVSSSKVFALDIFIPYSHFHVVQLIGLTSHTQSLHRSHN